MTVYALRLANNADTAARVRFADLLALPAGASPLTSFSALRRDGGGVVTPGGGMAVSVAAFIGWVQGGVSVPQGGYVMVSDSAVSLAIAAGHASLVRTDVVCAVVRDNAFDTSGTTAASVEVVTGTPGAGAPTVPTNSIPLYNIVVPAGTSAGGGGITAAMLADRRAYLDRDLPWTNLAVTGNMSGTIQYARRGGVVFIAMSGTKSTTSGAILATLPAALAPSLQLIFANLQAGGSLSGCYIDTAGNIRSDFGGGAYGTFSYPVG